MTEPGKWYLCLHTLHTGATGGQTWVRTLAYCLCRHSRHCVRVDKNKMQAVVGLNYIGRCTAHRRQEPSVCHPALYALSRNTFARPIKKPTLMMSAVRFYALSIICSTCK